MATQVNKRAIICFFFLVPTIPQILIYSPLELTERAPVCEDVNCVWGLRLLSKRILPLCVIMPSERVLSDQMRPILYKVDLSPPSRTVMMVAELLGVDLDLRDLNPVLREQDTPEFVKKNPMRTIPIWDEGDFSLADSHAIVLYLIHKYGKPEHSYLYPDDKRIRATINHRLFFDCGVLFPRVRAVMIPTYVGVKKEMTKSDSVKIDLAYEMMEYYLSETKYLADDVITVADFSAVTSASTLDGLHPVDEKRFPKLRGWLTNMGQHEICRKINEPYYKEHVASLKLLMEYNKNKEQKSKL